MTMSNLNTFSCFCVISLYFVTNAFECYDDNNATVDWWVVYKVPRVLGHSDKQMKYGRKYVYLDSRRSSWEPSSHSIDEPDAGALTHTLKQIYEAENRTETFYLKYNDAYPDGTVNWQAAHSKGVVAFDDKRGFWLIHSVPKFPPVGHYEYPNSGKVYGQTLMCITFAKSDLSEIAQQLFYMGPGVYEHRVPQALAEQLPVLQMILDGRGPNMPPYVRRADLQSAAGQPFTHFAKSKLWRYDLYHEFVAPSLKAPMLVETWRHGERANMPSNCTHPFYVENVNHVTLTATYSFPSLQDHSKWAVSDGLMSITCIGDINRQVGQLRRGGGTMCAEAKGLWMSFRRSIDGFEDCPVQLLAKRKKPRHSTQ